MVASTLVGNRSSGSTRVGGAGLGSCELFSSADEWRSLRPRTYTYLPWLTLMPATRARASAAVLSPWRSRSCFDTWVMIAGLASIGSGMYSPRTPTASSSVADDGAAACSVDRKRVGRASGGQEVLVLGGAVTIK